MERTKHFILKTRAKILKNAHHVQAKYAVVTYASQVKIITKKFTESMTEFNHDVNQNLQKDDRAIRFMHLGIDAASQLLQNIGDDAKDSMLTSTKIMIIVSQGRVGGTRQRSGYTLARMASITARKNHDIKIVSTSDNISTTDLRTLRAVASYPKKLNAVVGGELIDEIAILLGQRILKIVNNDNGESIYYFL